MLSNPIPKVHYFGTCRVHAPLKSLSDSGKIELLDNEWSFLHTTKEILQAIEVLHGKHLASPVDGFLAGFPSYTAGQSGGTKLEDADFIVVEISSLKIFNRNGVFMQLNRLREKTVVVYPELEHWFKTLERCGIGELPTGARLEDFGAISNLVKEARCYVMEREELLVDINRILSHMPTPTVLVSCFNYPRHDGLGYLPPRTLIKEAIGSVRHERLMGTIDTTCLLEAAGFENVTRDSAHYKDSFIPTLSNYFYEQFGSWSDNVPFA